MADSGRAPPSLQQRLGAAEHKLFHSLHRAANLEVHVAGGSASVPADSATPSSPQEAEQVRRGSLQEQLDLAAGGPPPPSQAPEEGRNSSPPAEGGVAEEQSSPSSPFRAWSREQFGETSCLPFSPFRAQRKNGAGSSLSSPTPASPSSAVGRSFGEQLAKETGSMQRASSASSLTNEGAAPRPAAVGGKSPSKAAAASGEASPGRAAQEPVRRGGRPPKKGAGGLPGLLDDALAGLPMEHAMLLREMQAESQRRQAAEDRVADYEQKLRSFFSRLQVAETQGAHAEERALAVERELESVRGRLANEQRYRKQVEDKLGAAQEELADLQIQSALGGGGGGSLLGGRSRSIASQDELFNSGASQALSEQEKLSAREYREVMQFAEERQAALGDELMEAKRGRAALEFEVSELQQQVAEASVSPPSFEVVRKNAQALEQMASKLQQEQHKSEQQAMELAEASRQRQLVERQHHVAEQQLESFTKSARQDFGALLQRLEVEEQRAKVASAEVAALEQMSQAGRAAAEATILEATREHQQALKAEAHEVRRLQGILCDQEAFLAERRVMEQLIGDRSEAGGSSQRPSRAPFFTEDFGSEAERSHASQRPSRAPFFTEDFGSEAAVGHVVSSGSRTRDPFFTEDYEGLDGAPEVAAVPRDYFFTDESLKFDDAPKAGSETQQSSSRSAPGRAPRG